MDITTLNVFQWCKFLKHTGRAVMAAFVAAIVALAAYATFSAALVPGIQSGDLPLQIVYSLLCIIYFGIVSGGNAHRSHITSGSSCFLRGPSSGQT